MPGNAELIGTYVLPVDDALSIAQARELYGQNPTQAQLARTRKQLESAALVEVLVSNADARFQVRDFVQEDPQLPREKWQAPWAVAFLAPDGESLLVKRWRPLPTGTTNFRVAFYIHFWKAAQPLMTSYGSLDTSQPSPMAERLSRLVPYVLLD